ncbi:MAG: hypothetical protein WDN69_11890 [Aliidongia sp.]
MQKLAGDLADRLIASPTIDTLRRDVPSGDAPVEIANHNAFLHEIEDLVSVQCRLVRHPYL